MGAEICANCGEPITLTGAECDRCGWVPQSKRLREELAARKAEYRKLEQHAIRHAGDQMRRLFGRDLRDG